MYAVAVTAIIRRYDGRMLITKRHPDKKKWPSKWTVPGGQLEDTDFIGTPTEINNQWYGTLENAVRREVEEETKLEINNIRYLCNIAIPGCIIISFVADCPLHTFNNFPNAVFLQEDECTEYAWVTAREAEEYDLIDGLLDELREAEATLKLIDEVAKQTPPPPPSTPNQTYDRS